VFKSKLINNLIVKIMFKTIVNKNEVLFVAKLFSISVYADRRINALELNELKREIKEYINSYYSMLNDSFKEVLTDYLYKKSLTILEELKSNDEYYTLLQKEVTYEIKLLKKKNEIKKLSHILNMIKDILMSDKVYTEEEKEFFNNLQEEVFR